MADPDGNDVTGLLLGAAVGCTETGVDLVLVPDTQSNQPGEIAVLTLRVETNGKTMNGFQSTMTYDSGLLQVVDDTGAPATEIEGNTDILDAIFTNEVVNGTINYDAAAFLKSNPSAPFDAATIKFKVIQCGIGVLPTVEFAAGTGVAGPAGEDITGLLLGTSLGCEIAPPTPAPSPTTPPTPTTTPLPEADAGVAQTVDEGDTVTLDGSASSGTSISYSWTQISGPTTVDLVDADTVSPSFVAPDEGIYTFQLVVTGPGGTRTDTVSVEVLNVAPDLSLKADPRVLPKEGGTSKITAAATDVAADIPDLRYSFDCGDDGTFEKGPKLGNTANCVFTAADVGGNTVRVKVKDADGGETLGGVRVFVGAADPDDWDATLSLTGTLADDSLLTGNPIRTFGVRPGCSEDFEINSTTGVGECDTPGSIIPSGEELQAFWSYPDNSPSDFFDTKKLLGSLIGPPSPVQQARMWPLRVEVNKPGEATTAEITIEWDIAGISEEFITVLLIDRTSLPVFEITNMGQSLSGSYTFTIDVPASPTTVTRDFTVVASRAQVQALPLSTGPQVIALSVKPVLGARVEDIFKFTGPDRLSIKPTWI